MLLKIENLSGGYGGGDICKGISCAVGSGEVLCVLGPNGCGKSTFFRLILGFIKHSSGEIYFDDKPFSGMSRRQLAQTVAYIPQNHSPVFAYTVLEMVTMGRTGHFSAFASPGENDNNEALAALERLNLLPLANSKYTALSGGQRQLVLIARALCQRSQILIMDEPAASLDYANQRLVLDIAEELAHDGYCVIMSTHSPDQPFSCAHKVLLLREGEVFGFGTPHEVLTNEALLMVYGLEMEVLTVRDRYGIAHTLCLPVRAPHQ